MELALHAMATAGPVSVETPGSRSTPAAAGATPHAVETGEGNTCHCRS